MTTVGKLKLKTEQTKDRKKKKNKKRKRESTEEPLEHESKKTKSDTQSEQPALETAPVADPIADWRTPSQKAFDTVQEQRKQALLEKSIVKSHRQKIDDFNEKLSKLSEHYDIPKVGPG